jgi:hypothetical protein
MFGAVDRYDRLLTATVRRSSWLLARATTSADRKQIARLRPLHGPAPHDVVWRPADSARVIHVLKNPAYALQPVFACRAGLPDDPDPDEPSSPFLIEDNATSPKLRTACG